MRLNDRANGLFTPVAEPAVKVGRAIGRSLYRAPVGGGVAPARRAYQELTATLAEAKRETLKLKVDGIEGGEEFLAAFRRFYEIEEELLRVEIGSVVDSLDNLKISMVEREQRFHAAVARAVAKEKRSHRELQLARQAFALRNRIPLDRWIDPEDDKEKAAAD